MLDFRVPVSYSRTIIVFVGVRYKHLRVQDERSKSLPGTLRNASASLRAAPSACERSMLDQTLSMTNNPDKVVRARNPTWQQRCWNSRGDRWKLTNPYHNFACIAPLHTSLTIIHTRQTVIRRVWSPSRSSK